MQSRELEQFLAETFQSEKFQDFCHNGLQVAGKESIHKIAFGVSFNRLLVEAAIAWQADALMVHHGIFGKQVFRLTGVLREKVHLLLQHGMALFGMHLPLDAHRTYGHNAQLFQYLGGEPREPYDVGFIGDNPQRHGVSQLLEIFHQKLHATAVIAPIGELSQQTGLRPQQRHGFWYLPYGPDIPTKIAIISGGAAKCYSAALEQGIDTFICGNMEEPTPALAYESRTNFINLGHYWSEKPGILALQQAIQQQFAVETRFIEIENVI